MILQSDPASVHKRFIAECYERLEVFIIFHITIFLTRQRLYRRLLAVLFVGT